MVVNLVVGVDSKTYGIGCKGGIPWKNKEDMKWFKKLTTGNACIMGWTTFISLGKPLKDRLNIVISPDFDATTYFAEADNSNVRNARSLEDAIQIAKNEKYGIAFVIGGGSIYRQYLEKDLIDTMFVDYIDNSDKEDLEFDTYFPFDAMHKNGKASTYASWTTKCLGYSEDGKNRYMTLQRVRTKSNDVDKQYLDLLDEIKTQGQTKHTRAGETLSIFGNQLRFNAVDQLPILTTKKVYTKGCITELLWFIKGDTNIKYLIDNGCHIWDDDAYRYFNDLIKQYQAYDLKMSKSDFLDHVLKGTVAWIHDTYFYKFGDLGPVYGKQWNDWNGINQIDVLIEKLKTNPDDRRLIISSWNVGELKDMALPPCHYLTQWYVTKLSDQEKEAYKKTHNEECPEYGLSVMWNQRSVDTCLGLPYNILSYSIFLYMVAQCVNMAPLEVICNLGDTHIYKNQLDGVEEQLIRNPYLYNLPTLHLNKDIKNIRDFTLDDIKIENYKSYPTIKFPLSVG
jgi:thymidylate synthase